MVKNIKKWLLWHRWTSLICTIFLLIICITGLPLIFRDQVLELLEPQAPYPEMPASTPLVNLDKLVATAYQHYPTHVINYMYVDEDAPQVVVNMLPNYGAPLKFNHSLHFDARTGALREDTPPEFQQPQSIANVIFSLHTDLFLDLPGELFLCLMGILFVISIITGIVLYGPYMKKLSFGTVRRGRSRRFRWLDLHNLLGIATGAWLLVVGATGVMNELSTPLFGIWGQTDVKQMLAPYKGKPTVQKEMLSSANEAYATAQAAVPGMQLTSLVFPGNPFGSPYHYLIWTKGNTTVTSRLFSPVLVDARSGQLSAVVKMPWYLRALEVSRPLHFGDYGGMPLKILWALFDVVCIVVLISGIYLWFARRKTQEAYFSQVENATA